MTALQIATTLTIVGQLTALIGAGLAAWAIIVDDKTATELASPMWDLNERLKAAILSQSKAARHGLLLVALGTLLQVGGTIVPLF